jgi:heterodisulfide reductase subunit A
MLGVKLDQEGLVENPPAGSDMVRTSKPGIFIAGTAESPKDARESMAQGRDAAMAALQHMAGGWLHSTLLHET